MQELIDSDPISSIFALNIIVVIITGSLTTILWSLIKDSYVYPIAIVYGLLSFTVTMHICYIKELKSTHL
jgi:multisubunit Na+/H+ antiporter MnhF subunit